jgi:flagellar FliJ protein
MAKTQWSALALAITQAERARDAARQKSAQCLSQLRFGQAQLKQLQGYAEETDQRWVGLYTGTVAAEVIRHRYQFMDRLMDAIGLQKNALQTLQTQLDAANQALLLTEQRLMALQKVLALRQRQWQAEQARREQRITDEFASQQHARAAAKLLIGETI